MSKFKLISIYCSVFFRYKVSFSAINEYENENNDNLIRIIIRLSHKTYLK